jgi:hypothetical protein
MVVILPFVARNETKSRRKPQRTPEPVRHCKIVSVVMGMLRRRGFRAAAWLAGLCVFVAACGSSNPLGGASTNVNSIVVGSAGFPESKIIAETYAQALQTNGFNVGRRMGIGSRETYVPALKDHSIDLVPEYIGNLLQYFEPNETVTMLDAVELELYKRLPGDLSILRPSPAADTDTVTVTAETAAKWNLKTIGDLAAHSPEVKFAAPSDFQARASGLVGLRQRYGLDIAPGNFVAISDDGGPVRSCTGERYGQRRQHLQHVTGHHAEPSGGARGSGTQLPGRQHCAAGEFAEEIRSAQRCAGRGIGQNDHPRSG